MRLAAAERLICSADALSERGAGVRFTVEVNGVELPAFAVRYDRRVHAYVNRCTHRATELDWEPGRFFDFEGRFLVCATHGALYHPATGDCVLGPCRAGLAKLDVVEKNSAVYWIANSG